MSVLIKGMKMPPNCQNCFACDDESRFCRAAIEYIPMLGKPKFCPLIELPDHGDLIDRDKVWVRTMDYCDLEEAIMKAPAVIPAERSKECEG